MSTTPVYDKLTEEAFSWAKRAATAAGRGQIDVPDLMCGFCAVCEKESSAAGQLVRLLSLDKDAAAWPEGVRALLEQAASVPEEGLNGGTFPFCEPLLKAVDVAWRADSKLPFNLMVREVIKLRHPVTLEFRELNRPEGVARLDGFLSRIEKARCESRQIVERLEQRVLGQPAALRMLEDALFTARLSATGKGPRGVFTFMGPPGVGKTLLAECFAEELASVEDGKGHRFLRLDMGMYSAHQNHEGLFGMEEFYSNSKPGVLTGFVQQNPRSVILLDEIEKAHENVLNSLLAVLDKGEVVDKKRGKPVSFRDTWFIITTNLGREIYGEGNELGVLGAGARSKAELFEILGTAMRRGDQNKESGGAVPALSPELVSRLSKGGAVLFGHLEIRHLIDLVGGTLKSHFDGMRSESNDAVPEMRLDDDTKLMLLARMLPNLDARRTVAATTSWAGEVLRESFDALRDEITTSGRETYTIDVGLDERARAWLEGRRSSFLPTLLLVDDNHYFVGAIRQACGADRVTIKHLGPDHFAAGPDSDVPRADVCFLDLSIGEPSTSACIDKAMDILSCIRSRRPSMPVYLFSENPDSREDFDRMVERVLRNGGARDFIPSVGDPANPVTLQNLGGRVAGIVEEMRRQHVLNGLERGRVAIGFTTTYEWLPDSNTVRVRFADVSEGIAYKASDRVGPIRFAGVPIERFSDVVGLTRAKKRMAEVIRFIREREILGRFGVNPPKGFLLSGPPGTGKTLLARAVAGEAGLPFLALSAGELQSKWLGESEQRIRDLFERARRYAPSIVFIDEIDAIARSRDRMETTSQTGILNQLLASMDGFAGSDRPVFVLAATNHADSLDPAILRPGRFDETIAIDLPDPAARRRLFELRGLVDDPELLDKMVRYTAGCTPADLDRIWREACYAAASDGRARVEAKDLEQARQLVVFGPGNNEIVLEEKDRRMVAIHEAGHAVAHALLRPDIRMDLVTILPRSDGALGFMSWTHDDKVRRLTTAKLRSDLAVMVAGRVAEELLGGDPDGVDAGAAHDLERATRLAYHAVALYGFDPDHGNVSMNGLPAPLSTACAEQITSRVNQWISKAAKECRELLTSHQQTLTRLADMLLEQETIDGAEVERLVRS